MKRLIPLLLLLVPSLSWAAVGFDGNTSVYGAGVAGTTTGAIAIPGNTGDCEILTVNTGSSSNSITTPSGWNLLDTNQTDTRTTTAWYSRSKQGGDTTVTVSWSLTENWYANITAVSGADSSGTNCVIDAHQPGGSGGTPTTSLALAGVTTSFAGDFVLNSVGSYYSIQAACNAGSNWPVPDTPTLLTLIQQDGASGDNHSQTVAGMANWYSVQGAAGVYTGESYSGTLCGALYYNTDTIAIKAGGTAGGKIAGPVKLAGPTKVD